MFTQLRPYSTPDLVIHGGIAALTLDHGEDDFPDDAFGNCQGDPQGDPMGSPGDAKPDVCPCDCHGFFSHS